MNRLNEDWRQMFANRDHGIIRCLVVFLVIPNLIGNPWIPFYSAKATKNLTTKALRSLAKESRVKPEEDNPLTILTFSPLSLY